MVYQCETRGTDHSLTGLLRSSLRPSSSSGQSALRFRERGGKEVRTGEVRREEEGGEEVRREEVGPLKRIYSDKLDSLQVLPDGRRERISLSALC